MTTQTTAPVSQKAESAPRWLYYILVGNLFCQTGIVITGGLVRLTGSGLGCPTWPQCTPESLVPVSAQEEGFHKFIEFGNRTLTFLLTAFAIAALVGVYVWNKKRVQAGTASRTNLLRLAVVPLIGTFAQAFLGGLTVITGLNPLYVAAHFLVSALLMAASLALVVRSKQPADEPVQLVVHPAVRWLSWLVVVVGFIVLTLGTIVTGSGPHSGDADVEHRLPFNVQTMSWLHADAVMVFIGLIVGLIVCLIATKAPAHVTKRAVILIVICLLQGVIGYTQYFLAVPWVLVMFHLLGACAVWLAVLTTHFSEVERG